MNTQRWINNDVEQMFFVPCGDPDTDQETLDNLVAKMTSLLAAGRECDLWLNKVGDEFENCIAQTSFDKAQDDEEFAEYGQFVPGIWINKELLNKIGLTL